MVYIPYPPGYDHEEVPTSNVAAEVDANRLLTTWFISQDPTDVVLTRRVQERTASGATKWTDGAQVPNQKVKLIYGGNTGGGRAGLVRTGDGTERMFSYIMVMEWDADIKPGDHWQDPNGQWWEVEEVLPDNGYERKATLRSYGKEPLYG